MIYFHNIHNLLCFVDSETLAAAKKDISRLIHPDKCKAPLCDEACKLLNQSHDALLKQVEQTKSDDNTSKDGVKKNDSNTK